jgi:hypothetical protein
MSDFKIPAFANEDEEAKRWFDNQELIFVEFERAAKEGRLRRGGVRRLFAEKGIPFPEPQKAPKPPSATTIRRESQEIAKGRAFRQSEKG